MNVEDRCINLYSVQNVHRCIEEKWWDWQWFWKISGKISSQQEVRIQGHGFLGEAWKTWQSPRAEQSSSRRCGFSWIFIEDDNESQEN